jgi:hypothetical protein
MKSESPSLTFVNFGMLCIAIISMLITFESARTARESVHLQAAQLQPQLDYSCTPIVVQKDVIHFNISLNNLGPTTAVISSFWVILYTENGTIWYHHFLENAIVAKGQSRVVQVDALTTQNFGNKTINLLDKFKAEGIQIEVRYSVNGLQDQTYVDSRKFPAVVQ